MSIDLTEVSHVSDIILYRSVKVEIMSWISAVNVESEAFSGNASV